MILFVAHDPGAKNHIMPLFEHVRAQGQAARFIDLAVAQHCEPADAIPNQPVRLLVTGWSVNQAEWPWVLAAREVPACRVSVTGNPYLERLIDSKPASMETAPVTDNSSCHKNLPLVSVFLPNYGAPAASAKPVRGTRDKVLTENYLGATSQAWTETKKFVCDTKRS